jgi:hypothetical protein
MILKTGIMFEEGWANWSGEALDLLRQTAHDAPKG